MVRGRRPVPWCWCWEGVGEGEGGRGKRRPWLAGDGGGRAGYSSNVFKLLAGLQSFCAFEIVSARPVRRKR